jgi:hypothetical protein
LLLLLLLRLLLLRRLLLRRLLLRVNVAERYALPCFVDIFAKMWRRIVGVMPVQLLELQR